ncbi:MAG: paraquat-inducible protein A [Gammaproteobacteria bacterium]|nr:paraquat-inducible protein A [Gammaproteobacteria bacterium]NNF66526.1 paraquat-inducible membrane protein A [Gammaproteobacteria bacterium]
MPEATTAISQGLQGCTICTSVSSADGETCPVCGAGLHAGWSESIPHTWAWLITSAILYIPANFLPIMYTRFFGKETANTILGGVVTLWEHGSYPIALIIFIASVLVPLGKIFVLAWLCLSIQFGSQFAVAEKTRLYRVTEFVGRWSMIDVFVVGILVALIQLGNIMSIVPGLAALAFAAMVGTTMLAAMAFDPRLLWASINEDQSELLKK